jgi:hypothetical protein
LPECRPVKTVPRIERGSLPLLRLKHSAAGCERGIRPLQVSLTTCEQPGKTVRIRDGQFHLLVSCGLHCKQRFLPLAFGGGSIQIGLRGSHASLCGIDGGGSLGHTRFGTLDLGVLNALRRLVIFEFRPRASQGCFRFL